MKIVYAITINSETIPLIEMLPFGNEFDYHMYETTFDPYVWIFDPSNPSDSHIVSEDWTYDEDGRTHIDRYPHGLVRILG